MSKRYKGILCILAAAFCFAIMNASVRASGELPAMQKAFFRNIVALVCLCSAEKSGTPVRWKKENFWLLFIRAAAGNHRRDLQFLRGRSFGAFRCNDVK